MALEKLTFLKITYWECIEKKKKNDMIYAQMRIVNILHQLSFLHCDVFFFIRSISSKIRRMTNSSYIVTQPS